MKKILILLCLFCFVLGYSQIPTELSSLKLTGIQEFSAADSIAVVNNQKVIGYMKLSTLSQILDVGGGGNGDMLKSVYDTNNNGVVDNSEIANTVLWGNITGLPSFGTVATTNNYLDLDNLPTITDGEDGNRILNGTGPPTVGIGNDDDFYIDTTNSVFYGPKVSGAWGNGVSLKGQDGADGQPGQGVPTGGTTGQVLTKVDGANYNVSWQDISIPTLDEVLTAGNSTLQEAIFGGLVSNTGFRTPTGINDNILLDGGDTYPLNGLVPIGDPDYLNSELKVGYGLSYTDSLELGRIDTYYDILPFPPYDTLDVVHRRIIDFPKESEFYIGEPMSKLFAKLKDSTENSTSREMELRAGSHPEESNSTSSMIRFTADEFDGNVHMETSNSNNNFASFDLTGGFVYLSSGIFSTLNINELQFSDDYLSVKSYNDDSGDNSEIRLTPDNIQIMAPNLYYDLGTPEFIINSAIDVASNNILVNKGWVLENTSTSTGLESINEGGADGWRLIGRDPTFFGNIGSGAVDFTHASSGTDYGATGIRSFAANAYNKASGQESAAFGNFNASSGKYSFVTGNSNTATNESSAVLSGRTNEASGKYSVVLGGYSNRAGGDNSTVSGERNSADSFAETVFGAYSTTYVPESTYSIRSTDRIFNIGNGTNYSSIVRSDALTILKNGKTGVGYDNFETTANPELLQVNGEGYFEGTVKGHDPVDAQDFVTLSYFDANSGGGAPALGFGLYDNGGTIDWGDATTTPGVRFIQNEPNTYLSIGNVGLTDYDGSSFVIHDQQVGDVRASNALINAYSLDASQSGVSNAAKSEISATTLDNVSLGQTNARFRTYQDLPSYGSNEIYSVLDSSATRNQYIKSTITDGGNDTYVEINHDGGIEIGDGINSKGAHYLADYSANGLLDDRWIPDIAAVRQEITDSLSNRPVKDSGTFVPIIVDRFGGATYSTGQIEGTYYRSGDIIHFTIHIDEISTSGTPSSKLTIGNLPFDIAKYSVQGSVTTDGTSVSFYSIDPYQHNPSNEFYFRIQTTLDGDNTEDLTAVTFTSGSIYIAGSYLINRAEIPE